MEELSIEDLFLLIVKIVPTPQYFFPLEILRFES